MVSAARVRAIARLPASGRDIAVVYIRVSYAPLAVTRREFIKATTGVMLPAIARQRAPVREILYNGIVLPAPWPPLRAELPTEYRPPYYLVDPPPVIDIDVGRQLFVDDFLI